MHLPSLPSPISSCFFFFFLMIRRPPRSTLFPYTTLFRSPISFELEPPDVEEMRGRLARVLGKYPWLLCEDGGEVLGDRKSTRLNSSHTVISYAVFCLKKKKRISRSTVATIAHLSTKLQVQ